MTGGLRLSPDLELPLSFATEGIVVVGVRGSGKSNTEVRYAECLHGAEIPFVAIDPKGDWYGIRLAGEAPGLPIPVFGGLYGDFPIDATLGAAIADLLVDNNISAVLDVSRMSHAARGRFLTDFFKRLMERHQVEPHVRTVIFEEAHRYIPQQVKGDAAALKEAAAAVLLEGRSFGLGCWACTQRPARLHNDVLEEVDTAIIHRIGVTATADLKRIRDWVKHEDLGDEIGASLTKLRAGEAWVLSPVSLGIVRRVQIDRRQTFDSGATPVVGSEGTMKRRLSTMADIDVSAIKDALAETIEKAREADPAELRRQIEERDRRIDAFSSRIRLAKEALVETGYFTPDEVGDDVAPRIVELWAALRDKEPERVEVPVLTDEAIEAIEDLTGALNRAFDASAEQVNALLDLLDGARRLSAGAKEDQGSVRGSSAPQVRRPDNAGASRSRTQSGPVPPIPAGKTRSGSEETRPPASTGTTDGVRVSGPQQKILDVLADFEAVGVAAPTRGQIGWKAGVSPRGSGYEKNLSTLRTAGLVDYPASGRVRLTPAGRTRAVAPSRPGTVEELQEAILALVSKPQAAILRALLRAHPRTLDRPTLADEVGVSPSTSGYEKNLSTLRSLGLVDYPQAGLVALTEQMFLAGAA